MTGRFWEGARRVTVDSGDWTGGTGVLDRSRSARAPEHPTPRFETDTLDAAQIAEYKKVAEEIGCDPADILVEEFRAFLAANDLPTFSLSEVVAHMDTAARKDNPTGWGWHWCPVRPKDGWHPMTFGRPSSHDQRTQGAGKITASDFYESHRFERANYGDGRRAVIVRGDLDGRNVPHYSRTLPLHALKKIALIERRYKGGEIVFLVSDYEMEPRSVISPEPLRGQDPFLMAVIPNSGLALGKGRFVIDVWDEPGFGIAQMVK